MCFICISDNSVITLGLKSLLKNITVAGFDHQDIITYDISEEVFEDIRDKNHPLVFFIHYTFFSEEIACTLDRIRYTFDDALIIVHAGNLYSESLCRHLNYMGADAVFDSTISANAIQRQLQFTIKDWVSQQSAKARQKDLQKQETKDLFDRIPKRKYQVAMLLAKGKTNKEISDELCLSVGTVKNYISDLLDLMQVYNRTQASVLINEVLNGQQAAQDKLNGYKMH